MFRTMLMHHTSSKLLKHMFVDESHQIATELSCRPDFTQIKTQFFNMLPKFTNLMLMSGTFINTMENRLKQQTGVKIINFYGMVFFRREVYFQLCARRNFKSIILENLKVLLVTFRLNPAILLPHEFLICCNTLKNMFDLFDEFSEVLDITDSNCYKETREKLVEEAPRSLLHSDGLSCTGNSQEKMQYHIVSCCDGNKKPSKYFNLRVLLATSATSTGIDSEDLI